MTTEEMIREACLEVNFHFNQERMKWTKKLMKDYARQKCKEQREICSNTDRRRDMDYHTMAEWAIKENIRDSPEPEFE